MKSRVSHKNKRTYNNEKAYPNWHFYVDLKTKSLHLPRL